MFRRFNELNAKMLLYMQADLCRLETALAEAEHCDNRGSGNKAKYARNFEYLASSHKDGDTRQLEIVAEIKVKLKEYSKYLTSTSVIHSPCPLV